MILRKKISILVAITLAIGVATLSSAKEDKPVAQLALSAKAVGVGVGWSWGGGSLKFKGHRYTVKVDGLEVGSVGASQIQASGEVYNLKRIEDFAGTYAAVGADAAVGGGAGAFVMQNQNGVQISLDSTQQGIKFTAGVSGIKMSIER